MKTIFIIIAAAVVTSCGESSTRKSGKAPSTASDTITNVTNPGVGTAADDTLQKL